MKKWIVLKDQRLGEGEGNIPIQVFANQIIEGNPEEFFAFNKKTHLSILRQTRKTK